jgi:hypothetical protein
MLSTHRPPNAMQHALEALQSPAAQVMACAQLPLPGAWRFLNDAVENPVNARWLAEAGDQHPAFERIALASAQLTTVVDDALDRGRFAAEDVSVVEFELDSARSAVLRQLAANTSL